MSFITQEDYEDRMNNPRNLINREEFSSERSEASDKEIEQFIETGSIINSDATRTVGIQGKVLGDRNIPEVIRDVITIQSNFAPVSDVARSWGVSPASASNLSNGIPDRINPNGHRNIRAQEVLESSVKKIRKVVEKKILKTLELITQEALEEQDAKSLSIIANNLSSVVNKIEPKDLNLGNTINVQTIFYSPAEGKIEDYEIING